jgi:hypothetical protein
MKEDTDVLIQKYTVIKIDGKEFKIGVISTRQLFQLIKFIGELFKIASDVQKEFAGKEDISNTDALSKLFSMLNEKQAAKLLMIFMSTDDEEFLLNMSADDALTVFEQVCLFNDFDKLLKKVMQALGQLGIAKQQSPANTTNSSVLLQK